MLINSLIEAAEKLAYDRKENCLAFLPEVAEAISKENQVKSLAEKSYRTPPIQHQSL
jgi:hypothetical protein